MLSLEFETSRLIVHFCTGNYPINESIVLPPNCDIQFLGKETAWTGTGTASYITWVGKYRGQRLLIVYYRNTLTFAFLQQHLCFS